MPYPVPPLPGHAWTALPTRADVARLETAARAAYRTSAPLLAVSGAQAAIQMIPRLGSPGQARILVPTYNEHAASLRAAGWTVNEVATMPELAGGNLAVVVNPNNPDGQCHTPEALRALAPRVGRLVVDESFVDSRPDLSLAPSAKIANILVLRSFGKFYGLAGIRLGFVIGGEADIGALAEVAGPWPVSGAAIAIGEAALSDHPWAEATRARLRSDADRLDNLARSAGWTIVGGTDLFRLYDVRNAADVQDRLAHHRIWTRIFPMSPRWLRLGLPGTPAEWDRLTATMRD